MRSGWCSQSGSSFADTEFEDTVLSLMTIQGIPLYEFLRNEAGASGSYVMPVPFLNVLNGGVHSGNTMAFQEIMLAPVGATSFEESIRMGSEVYQRLKKVVSKQYGTLSMQDISLVALTYELRFQLARESAMRAASLRQSPPLNKPLIS